MMLKPNDDKRSDKWKDRLTPEEAREILTMEQIMTGCETAYRAASKRREFIANRVRNRKGPSDGA